MTDIRDWSVTPASNTDLFPEGMAPSAVNDGMRTVQAEIAQLTADENGTLTLGGSSTDYTVTLNTAPASLSDGLYFWATANVASGTGPATLVVTPSGGSAFASKKIKKTGRGGETDIAAGDMIAGGHYLFHYDSAADSGTGAYLLINPQSSYKASTTVSASTASVDFTLPAGFRYFRLTFSLVKPVTNDAQFAIRFSTNSGSTYYVTSGDYLRQTIVNTSGAVIATGGALTETMGFVTGAIDNNTGAGASGELLIFPGSATRFAMVHGRAASHQDGATYETIHTSVIRALSTSAAVTAIRLLMSSGNIAGGEFTLEGIPA